MLRDEIVDHLERYATGFGAPVREGVEVASVEPVSDGGFLLRTSDGELRAGTVVVATGTYRRPYRPAGAASLPADIWRSWTSTTTGIRPRCRRGRCWSSAAGSRGARSPRSCWRRDARCSCRAGARRGLPRRIGDRDIVWWAAETGFLDHPVESLPSPAARLEANILATGHGGGHDLNLRTLRARRA